jgi:hypothetical protein
MFKNKSKIATILLIFVTIFLIGAIFYISTLLTTSNESKTSQIVPRKTKAASITYSKLIALNQVTPEPTQTPITEPTDQVSAFEETMLTPTPTETVLAYVSTDTASSEAEATTQVPTSVKDLPDAGFVYNGLIIFAAAMVLVFFSFLF